MTSVNVYVALLRGINVGGNNLIRMPALEACFETQGFREVSTTTKLTAAFISSAAGAS
jgi:uncharacterized protein (DUF1697 family)